MAAPLVGWFPEQFFDADGNPLSGGFIYSFYAGTSTPADTFAQSDLDPGSANPNPIELDADGRPPDPIFLSPIAYKFEVQDSTAVTLYTVDDVSDPGYIYSVNNGTIQVTDTAALNQVSGYVVLSTDRFVTMDSTGGANPCLVYLPAASDYAATLVVKNMGTVALAITPDGSDTIDGLAAAYAVAASSSPTFSTITLASDGVSAWWVLSLNVP